MELVSLHLEGSLPGVWQQTSQESARRWVIQSQVDGGQRQGATTEELSEIKALKAENRRLREDVEILRGATTFFVGELDPRNR